MNICGLKNVLVVAAHPDDAEINAGGCLSILAKKGVNIHVVICSSLGDHVGRIRMIEARESFRILSRGSPFSSLTFLCHQDTKLYLSFNELVKDLEAKCREIKADIIFTHFIFDAHQDHRTVSEAVMVVSRLVPNVIFFKPTFPSGKSAVPFEPNLVVRIEEGDLECKMLAISAHESQMKKYGDIEWIERIKDIAKSDAWVYGGFHGFAEVFNISKIIF